MKVEALKSRSLTVARARQLLSYDPRTGELSRRAESFRVGRVHKQPLTLNKDGHPVIKLDGVTYIASRVIFLMQTGEWPHPFCLHKDNDQTNLRWSNLAEADALELAHNRRSMKGAA